MHLVISTPEYPPHLGSGIPKFYGALTPRYVAAGHRVTVLVSNPLSDDFRSYEHEGVAVRCVPLAASRQHANALPHLSAAPTLRKWLGAARAAAVAASDLAPDVVESTDFGLYFAPFVARPAGPPVVVQMHGSIGQISTWEPPRGRDELDGALARMLEASLLPYADEIQALSPSNAQEWSLRLGRHCLFIPPPVETPARRPEPPREAALVVARIQPWKGAELLCEALERLGPAHGVKVEWIGRDTPTAPDGSSFNSYLLAKYKGVWGRAISPLGPRAPEEVATKQQAARFVIVPSAWDTFNLTVPEAMAAGRLVVCSDAVGASFLIRNGENGFLFTAGHAAALADALRRATELSEVELSAIGEAAAATVADVLNPERIACRRLDRMMELLKDGGAVRPPVADWTTAFIEESETRSASLDFLGNLSLRQLAGYISRRVSHRLRGRRA